MSIRSIFLLHIGCLATALPLALSTASASSDTPVAITSRTATPMTPIVHPDGSVSIALEQPDHGLIARIGADGRVRISCTDAQHAQMEKRAHEHLHETDATAWE